MADYKISELTAGTVTNDTLLESSIPDGNGGYDSRSVEAKDIADLKTIDGLPSASAQTPPVTISSTDSVAIDHNGTEYKATVGEFGGVILGKIVSRFETISLSNQTANYKDISVNIGKIIPQGALLVNDATIPIMLTLQEIDASNTRFRVISTTGAAYTSAVYIRYLEIT